MTKHEHLNTDDINVIIQNNEMTLYKNSNDISTTTTTTTAITATATNNAALMPNKNKINGGQYKTIEYHCRAIKSSFGIFDHYFIVIDDFEIHMGWYMPGKILPKNTTKNSHLVAVKKICVYCYNKITANLNLSEDARLINYYPFLNCESLTTGFSVQALAFLAIPMIIVFALSMQFLYMLIVILTTFLFILIYSKYMYSRTKYITCKHI